ncbi:MAG: hypothetical protein GXY08_13665 [Ruminococcus sp.]|nr:hypothetical protein [Ruminococcus sp.]
MQKIKDIKRRLAAAAASAVLAVTAVGGEIIPSAAGAVTSGDYSYVSESSGEVTLSMSLIAGGSKIGTVYYLTTEESISEYDISLDGSPITPEETSRGGMITADEYAMNMTKPHNIVVKKDGTVVLDKTVTVKDYLMKVLSKPQLSSYYSIAGYLLQYGAASQLYFGVRTDDLANKDLNGRYDCTDTWIDSEPGAARELKDSLGNKLKNAPVTYYGMNLSLRSEVRFALYFKVNSGADEDEARAFLEDFKFDDKQADVNPAGEGFFSVSTDVPVSHILDYYKFTNGDFSVDVSPVYYLAHEFNSDDDKIVLICKTLYEYGHMMMDREYELQELKNYYTREHSGEATYYELDKNNLGNAMLNDVRGDHYYAALNTEDYNTAMMAGAYLKVTGPKGSVDVYVVDKLPEGKPGDIDLDPKAFEKIADLVDGRVNVTWKIIPFNDPDKKNISYRFKNKYYNQYFSEIQILNHRYPIEKLEILKNGKMVEVERTDYNYFKDESGFGPSPYTFRITDIFGHEIIEENVDLSSGKADGHVQFPE